MQKANCQKIGSKSDQKRLLVIYGTKKNRMNKTVLESFSELYPIAFVSILDYEDMEEFIWKIFAEKHVDIYPQHQGHSFQNN